MLFLCCGFISLLDEIIQYLNTCAPLVSDEVQKTFFGKDKTMFHRFSKDTGLMYKR